MAENAPVSLPTPTLRHIQPQDLHDTGRLLVLYEQAVQEGLIGAAEADRLTFVALACHVILYRPQNAGGLLRRLIARQLYQVVTQDDEDAARQRLARYLYGEGTAPSPVKVGIFRDFGGFALIAACRRMRHNSGVAQERAQ